MSQRQGGHAQRSPLKSPDVLYAGRIAVNPWQLRNTDDDDDYIVNSRVSQPPIPDPFSSEKSTASKLSSLKKSMTQHFRTQLELAGIVPKVAWRRKSGKFQEPLLTPKSLARAVERSYNKDDLAFSWMLKFPQPTKVTPKQSAEFDKKLEEHGWDSLEEALYRCFENIVEEPREADKPKSEIFRKMMDAPLRWEQEAEPETLRAIYAKSASSKPTDSSKHKKNGSKRRHRVADSFDSSMYCTHPCDPECELLAKALQSTIELVHAFAETFGEAIAGTELGGVPSQHFDMWSQPDDEDSLCVCFRMGLEAVELLADISEYPVQLSHNGLRDLNIKISDPHSTLAFVKYDAEFRDSCRLFADPFAPGCKSVLRQADRLRLLHNKINEAFHMELLESLGLIQASLPLHNGPKLRELREEWGDLTKIFQYHQPICKVRDYFGEEIAFYFLFLEHMALWVCFLMAPAIGCHLWWQLASAPMRPRFVMMLIIMAWYRGFLSSWLQVEQRMANKWGIDAHKVSTLKKKANPRFSGEWKPSKENEEVNTQQVERWKIRTGHVLSCCCTTVFISLLLAVLVVEHYAFFKTVDLVAAKYPDRAEIYTRVLNTMLGVVTGIQIKVVDSLWDLVSNCITDLEFRPTLQQFHSSKRIKACVVKFISTIASMVFFAFVQPIAVGILSNGGNLGNKLEEDKFRKQLATQTCSILFTRFIALGGLNDTLLPYIKLYRKDKALALAIAPCKCIKDESAVNNCLNTKQAKLEVYTATDLNNDVLDVILPMCFVIFFGMVFPLSVPLLLIVVLTQVRCDAWKLTHINQRPYPALAKSLGVFDTFLEVCGIFMIAANVGIMMVEFGGTTEILPWSKEYAENLFIKVNHKKLPARWVIDALVFLLCFVLLCGMWRFLGHQIPEKSGWLRLEERRQALQRQHLFYVGNPEMRMRRVDFDATAANAARKNYARVRDIQTSGVMRMPGTLRYAKTFGRHEEGSSPASTMV